MNTLHYEQIPEELLHAARCLRHHGIMQGWGGMTGTEPWSIEGIGPTYTLQDKITQLEAALKAMTDQRDNYAEQARQRKKDYDDARERHWQTIQGTQEHAEQARLALCRLGLSPAHHPTLNDAIRGITEIMVALRADLADPPADVQELVLSKLGIMNGTCQVERSKTGHLTITAATDIFPCSKPLIQRLIDTHNAAITLVNARAQVNTREHAYDALQMALGLHLASHDTQP